MKRFSTNARIAISILVVPWPNFIKRTIYRRLLGYNISPEAHIGFSLVLCENLEMRRGSNIGHFNVVRGLDTMRLESNARIGQWNWITASAMFAKPPYVPTSGVFHMEHDGVITSRHYIDCSGGFVLGAFSILAGVRSTVLTHQIDIRRAVQTASPVAVGEYCFIGSNSKFVPGSRVPNGSIVAMGALVRGVLSPENRMWAGVPATDHGPAEGAWFSRSQEAVDLNPPETIQR